MSDSELDVELDCANPAAQLTIIDCQFKPVAAGPPPLKAQLRAGIYALRASVGDSLSERIEALRAGAAPYHFTLEAPEFESPIPIFGTSTVHEYQHGTPQQLIGGALDADLGGDARLLIYLRDTSGRNFDLSAAQHNGYARNFSGFRLLDRDGNLLVDFDAKAQLHADAGYLGALLQVPAGGYLLAWEHDGQRSCLALSAVAGYTLQLYLRLQPRGAGDTLELYPDFADAALVLDAIGRPFDPARQDLSLLESVRVALLDSQQILSPALLQSLLDSQADNPMLGIYAAYALLDDPQHDAAALRMAVAACAQRIGARHPDLTALAWACERDSGQRPAGFETKPWPQQLAALDTPPTLAPSWDLLVDCAQNTGGGRMPECRALRVAPDLAVSGLLLSWRQAMSSPPVRPLPADEPPHAARPAAAPSPVTLSVPEVTTRSTGSRASRSPFDAAMTTVRIAASVGGSLLGALGKTLSKRQQRRAAAKPKERIDTPEKAAKLIREISIKLPWKRLLASMKREGAQAARLSGLQRELMMTLRQAADNPDARKAVDAAYVEQLLDAHRITLDALVEALQDLIAQAFKGALATLKGR